MLKFYYILITENKLIVDFRTKDIEPKKFIKNMFVLKSIKVNTFYTFLYKLKVDIYIKNKILKCRKMLLKGFICDIKYSRKNINSGGK